MRGTDHYDKADGILADLDSNLYDEIDDRTEYQLRLAAAHAQLATAGALAALIAETKRGVAVVALDARRPLNLERHPQ